MWLEFTKMHGLGNDFVVFDAISQKVDLSAHQVRFIADRHFGIGCDQVLLVESPRAPGDDFHYRIFNGDGSEVEQCGNGARCFARYVLEQGLSTKHTLRVGTAVGSIVLTVGSDDQITVNMGVPILTPERIPFLAESEAVLYPLEVNRQSVLISALSMGNPHAVLQVDSVADAPVPSLGPIIERHNRFPRRCNVGFMEVVDDEHIRLRVYERGAGETLACGTGACAAVVAGRLRGLLRSEVEVHLPGGRLVVTWEKRGQPVWMKGPAERVYEGRINV